MYRHTQRARAVLLVFGIAGLVSLAIILLRPGRNLTTGPRLILVVASLAFLASALVFSSLTITVAHGQLEWFFGPRALRKSVPLSTIADVMPTTTSFLEGWGIHLTTRGWLYNVAGRRAVLITRRDGGQLMLGTDEPESLVAAIRASSEST